MSCNNTGVLVVVSCTELHENGYTDGNDKRTVREDANLKNTLALRTTRKRIEHVEENKGRKSHGAVARSAGRVIAHLANVDKEGARHNERR